MGSEGDKVVISGPKGRLPFLLLSANLVAVVAGPPAAPLCCGTGTPSQALPLPPPHLIAGLVPILPHACSQLVLPLSPTAAGCALACTPLDRAQPLPFSIDPGVLVVHLSDPLCPLSVQDWKAGRGPPVRGPLPER
jgi:hypothetical protein